MVNYESSSPAYKYISSPPHSCFSKPRSKKRRKSFPTMLKLKDYYVKLHKKKKKEENKTDSQAGKSPFQLNSHMDTS